MSRATDLIRLAAEAMDKGEDPFHISFLSEYEVTLDEAYDLSDDLAEAARLYLHLRTKPAELIALRMEMEGESELAAAFRDSSRLSEVTKELRELGQ